MTYLFRRASTPDLPDVLALLGERAKWLAERGHDQWQLRDPARDTEASIQRGDTWVLAFKSQAVATMTMTTLADKDFWSERERAEPALYLSKLATRVEVAGEGFGALLVDCAGAYANRRHIERLRWDVWRTNQRLQDYYLSLGAKHVRTAEVAGRSSGALFELSSRARQLEGVRMLDPIDTLATIPDQVREVPSLLGSSHKLGDHGPLPTHWHILDDITAPDMTGKRPTAPVMINGDDSRDQATLIDAGDGWRIHFYAPTSGTASGELLTQLRPGRIYQLRHVGNRPDCAVALRGDADSADATPSKSHRDSRH